MGRNLTKDKAILLAQQYCMRKFDKGAAMSAAGYSKNYSQSSAGQEVFENELVKAEIDRIMARAADTVDVTMAQICDGFLSIAFPPDGKRVNDSDRNMALANLAKCKEKEAADASDIPAVMSKRQEAEARILAKIWTSCELDGVFDKIIDRMSIDPAYDFHFQIVIDERRMKDAIQGHSQTQD